MQRLVFAIDKALLPLERRSHEAPELDSKMLGMLVEEQLRSRSREQ